MRRRIYGCNSPSTNARLRRLAKLRSEPIFRRYAESRPKSDQAALGFLGCCTSRSSSFSSRRLNSVSSNAIGSSVMPASAQSSSEMYLWSACTELSTSRRGISRRRGYFRAKWRAKESRLEAGHSSCGNPSPSPYESFFGHAFGPMLASLGASRPVSGKRSDASLP